MTSTCQRPAALLVWGVLAVIVIGAASGSAGEPDLNTGGTRWLDVIRLPNEEHPLALVQIQPLKRMPTFAEMMDKEIQKRYDKIFPKKFNPLSFIQPVGGIGFLVVRPTAGLSPQG